ncbi:MULTISPECIES: hypothetical protein [Ramlibacter]|uniref:Uncharacterized protein n=1 Tax=Ramlibacter pinisoli TaxID=2682844 RepID=A0A6N8IUZ6_9BURK|nr:MULTISPECIES: hypothetical protein [Ramlibacter]MBA2964995.1 hypothetical protein [Ramlibacter sp. CGMCC 1.13660]MVQ29960.1 hypothetical protein [Ramlibacter pinisoli]
MIALIYSLSPWCALLFGVAMVIAATGALVSFVAALPVAAEAAKQDFLRQKTPYRLKKKRA